MTDALDIPALRAETARLLALVSEEMQEKSAQKIRWIPGRCQHWEAYCAADAQLMKLTGGKG